MSPSTTTKAWRAWRAEAERIITTTLSCPLEEAYERLDSGVLKGAAECLLITLRNLSAS